MLPISERVENLKLTPWAHRHVFSFFRPACRSESTGFHHSPKFSGLQVCHPAPGNSGPLCHAPHKRSTHQDVPLLQDLDCSITCVKQLLVSILYNLTPARQAFYI